jgi:regulator of sirC expression with transglutaminase-like and TPR domain
MSFVANELVELTAEDRLAEANLLLARFFRPHVAEEKVLARLDELAARVDGANHLALRRVIAIAEGIGGNVEDYHHPDNHFLDSVLTTRRGIPLSLSVLWIEVGRRAGLAMEGVGMPGHFLVYAAGQLVDPFHYGEAIGFEEAASLVAAALGGAPRADRSWFEPVDSTYIVRRMLLNLERLFRQRGEPHHLEWVGEFLEAVAAP